MKRTIFPMLACIAVSAWPSRSLAGGSPSPGETVPSPKLTERDEGWRSDLEFLAAEARRLHADTQRPAHSQRFDDALSVLHESIPELTDDQVLAGLMKLVAILSDGHSAIYGPAPGTPLNFERGVLPLWFYSFPSGLFVVDGVDAWADYAGNRVVQIGGVPADEVLRRMSAYRGVDNSMTWSWMGPQIYARFLLMLREVGVQVSGSSVELTLEANDGEQLQVTVEGGEYELFRKLGSSPAATGEVPLYLSNLRTNYWMTPLPDCDAVYFQFNQVRNSDSERIPEFSLRLRGLLEDTGATSLIVDVRHNNGGNNTLLRPLIRALIEFDMKSPEHRIFVIAGRGTFSAAQNFINRVERWTDATFVGEPSSSSPNFVGEEHGIMLPFSRVFGSISTRYWQDSDPGDVRDWITPDLPVVPTAADYFGGVDPALAAILEFIGSN